MVQQRRPSSLETWPKPRVTTRRSSLCALRPVTVQRSRKQKRLSRGTNPKVQAGAQAMSSYFDGSPEKVARHYDLDQGPPLFPPYADDLACRVARHRPSHLLETAAGTGFLTRKLRDILPPTTRITATDLVALRLDVARPKFREEEVAFQVADALTLPYPD